MRHTMRRQIASGLIQNSILDPWRQIDQIPACRVFPVPADFSLYISQHSQDITDKRRRFHRTKCLREKRARIFGEDGARRDDEKIHKMPVLFEQGMRLIKPKRVARFVTSRVRERHVRIHSNCKPKRRVLT